MKTQSILQRNLLILFSLLILTPAGAQFFPSGGYQGGGLGSGGDEILVPAEEQSLAIPQGWSGISSYLDPLNDTVEILFEDVVSDMVIMIDMEKVYWPSMDINSIITWNTHSGYIIKMDNPATLPFRGFPISDPYLSVPGGWNVIPVLSASSVTTTELLDPLGDTLIIIKEVAGSGIYWPAMSINNLSALNPGKAYQMLVTDPCSVTFPEGAGKGAESDDEMVPFNQPWNPVHPTPNSHSIAFGIDALKDVENGDIIGAFNSTGSCAGVLEVVDKRVPFGTNAFGDDFTTPDVVEGMAEGEIMTFRLYRPATHQEFRMKVDFSPDLPNAGKFQMNGLSRVLRITLEPNSVKDLSQVNDFNVFPNPSKGDISLAFRFPVQNVDLSVYDIHGQGLIHETLNIKEKNVQPVLHLNTIPPGIYIIRVKNPDMVQYRRIIIVK